MEDHIGGRQRGRRRGVPVEGVLVRAHRAVPGQVGRVDDDAHARRVRRPAEDADDARGAPAPDGVLPAVREGHVPLIRVLTVVPGPAVRGGDLGPVARGHVNDIPNVRRHTDSWVRNANVHTRSTCE